MTPSHDARSPAPDRGPGRGSPDPDAVGGATGRPLHLSARALALVALGGAVGAPLRWGLSLVLPGPTSGWPTATFVTNLAGAFALGLLLEALARRGPDVGHRRGARLAVGTGLLGAFTTYSTFALEVDGYLRDGRVALGVGYALATVCAGLLVAAAGVAAGAAVGARRGRR